ncbi:MAG TPA: hypothetical protein VNI34_05830 [Candidatus Nitrosotalea sp.]|nr:hypothetical protein [Candidatus Nitrosotalea sp.]
MKPSDSEFDAWMSSQVEADLERLHIGTTGRWESRGAMTTIGRISMSWMTLLTTLKTQAVVIGATALVAVASVGTVVTGSPNPVVWGTNMVDSIRAGGSGPTAAAVQPSPSPSPTATPRIEVTAVPVASPPREVPETPAPAETTTPERSSEAAPKTSEGGDGTSSGDN